MDIFPRAADARSMRTRRTVLTKAIRLAGVGLVAPLANAAAPYVRLPREMSDTREECRRFAAEIEAVNFHLLIQPALQTMPLLLSTWASLAQFSRAARVDVSHFRAKTAVLAGNNAITLGDTEGGRRWFELAHTYARLSGLGELISLAHVRAANAGLYWDAPARALAADAALAIRHATTDSARGAGYGMRARVTASTGQQDAAVAAAARGIELAAPAGQAPRIDQWSVPLAHQHAARALARFPTLAHRVEAHTQEALRGLPQECVATRTHARLNVAEVRARGRHHDGAAQVILPLFDLPQIELQPVLLTRIAEIARIADEKDPENGPMRPVLGRLAALSA